MASRRWVTVETSEAVELMDEDKITSVMQMLTEWEYPELLRLRELINDLYTQKAEQAREMVIADTQRKFSQLGLSFDDVVAMQKKRKCAARTPAVPKYRSLDGKEWSGRGPIPKWIRELKKQGDTRRTT